MADEEVEERLPDEALARLTICSKTQSAAQLAEAFGLPPDEAWNEGERRKRGVHNDHDDLVPLSR